MKYATTCALVVQAFLGIAILVGVALSNSRMYPDSAPSIADISERDSSPCFMQDGDFYLADRGVDVDGCGTKERPCRTITGLDKSLCGSHWRHGFFQDVTIHEIAGRKAE